MSNLKYTPEDIDRIFKERVNINYIRCTFKEGLIAEWEFIYPTGLSTVEIDTAIPMYSSNFDEEVGKKIIETNIKSRLWEIVGKYTLGTGDKL